jgi:hypothetical protein
MSTERARGAASPLAPDPTIVFERIAVNPDQVAAWSLPSRPIKESDTRAKTIGAADSVELDAIEPDQLRQLVADALDVHVPPHEREVLEAEEDSERRILMEVVAALRRATVQIYVKEIANMLVIVVGDLINGFRFIGPFADEATANAFAEAPAHDLDEWRSSVELTAPD